MRDYGDRELARASSLALGLSCAGWIALLAGHKGVTTASCHCVGAATARPAASWRMLLAMNPPASLAMGWILMLAAMMAPALIAPVWHIRLQSLARRRARSIGLFLAAYSVIWMAAGCVLVAIELVSKLSATGAVTSATVVGIVALAWQCSPAKQVCLNRCHEHTALRALGVAADIDALKFGVAHGVWCTSSCWALMLFPMLLTQGHLAAMAIVGVFMWGERIERPRPPAWRLRGAGRAVRMVGAQILIRLRRGRAAPTALA